MTPPPGVVAMIARDNLDKALTTVPGTEKTLSSHMAIYIYVVVGL